MASLDLQAFSDESPYHRSFGLTIERLDGGVVLRGALGPAFAVDGDGAFAHGGAVASVLDMALAFALIAQTDYDWVTVDLRVDYVRPTALGAVTVQAEVLHGGRNLGRARGELRDGTGRVCAVAVGSFVPNANATGAAAPPSARTRPTPDA